MRTVRYTNFLDKDEYVNVLNNLLRNVGENYNFLWEDNPNLALGVKRTPLIPKNGTSFSDPIEVGNWQSFSMDLIKKDEKFCYFIKSDKGEEFYLDGAGVYNLMKQFRYSFDSLNGMKEDMQEIRKNILQFFEKDFLAKTSVLREEFNQKKSNLESKIKLDLK